MIFARALTITALSLLYLHLFQTPGISANDWTGWRNSLQPAGVNGPELILASGGTTGYRIIIPDSPAPQDEKAAEILARWLKEITGVLFPVMSENDIPFDSQKIISIGKTGLFRTLSTSAVAQDLQEEGYGIAVLDRRLFLWGGEKRGAINAVLAFLEEDLGCRWYTNDGYRVPRMPDLAARVVPRTYVPQLRLRDPFYYPSFNSSWSLMNRTNAPGAKLPERLGGNIDYADMFVHTFHRLVPPEEYLENHPEYFMLHQRGNRHTHQLCTTSPEVIRTVAREVLETLREHPHTEIISVSKNDGGRLSCLCGRCKSLDDSEGTNMAALLHLVNTVAAKIEDRHPRVVISTLAYLETIGVPKTMRPRRNVAIRVCNDMCSWPHPFLPAEDHAEFRNVLTSWSKVCNRMYIWDYNVNFSHYTAPMPNMDVIMKNIRFFVKNNAEGIMTQGAYQSAGAERGLLRSWVIAKLMWNPSLEVNELVQDFIWGYYGSAAPEIAEYDRLLRWQGEDFAKELYEPEGGIRYRMDHPFLSRDFIQRASEIFDRAERAAGSEEILRRVEEARIPIMYVQLANGPAFMGAGYTDVLDRFELISRRIGLTHIYEGRPNFEEILAGWREEAERIERWETAIRKFEVEDLVQFPEPGGIVFTGSSSIVMWKTLSEDMHPLPVIRRGFGGSCMSEALYFADRIVLPYKPKAVVVYEGDNDAASGKSPESIARDFKKFVGKVHDAYPGTPIYFIAIKPSLARWHLRETINRTNELIKKYAGETDSVGFFDVASPMRGGEGTPLKGLFLDDGLHMNGEGYKIWTSVIKPELSKLYH